jgi:pimeloyl-ACP methyl ester carboxylesterase
VIHSLAYFVVALVLIYAGSLLILWRFQEQVVFQPPTGAAASALAGRRVDYKAEDGVQLFAYLVGDCNANKTVVLAFHGNADLSRWLVPWAAELVRRTNTCVLIPEYRGYDGLSGSPSYASSALDARAALSYAYKSLGAVPGRLVFFGHSLGSAIAAELAAEAPPRVLVLQAPFSSIRAMARRMVVPGVAAFFDMISRVHFDTVARVQALRVPVWVAHGDRDIVVPARMGREVFEAATNRGDLLIVHGAGHNDVAEIGGFDYWRWLVRATTESAQASIPGAATGAQSAP